MCVALTEEVILPSLHGGEEEETQGDCELHGVGCYGMVHDGSFRSTSWPSQRQGSESVCESMQGNSEDEKNPELD